MTMIRVIIYLSADGLVASFEIHAIPVLLNELAIQVLNWKTIYSISFSSIDSFDSIQWIQLTQTNWLMLCHRQMVNFLERIEILNALGASAMHYSIKPAIMLLIK